MVVEKEKIVTATAGRQSGNQVHTSNSLLLYGIFVSFMQPKLRQSSKRFEIVTI
jgi:hypothetical protein